VLVPLRAGTKLIGVLFVVRARNSATTSGGARAGGAQSRDRVRARSAHHNTRRLAVEVRQTRSDWSS